MYYTKEEIKMKNKIAYEKNKNEKWRCDLCDKEYSYFQKYNHCLSKKHILKTLSPEERIQYESDKLDYEKKRLKIYNHKYYESHKAENKL